MFHLSSQTGEPGIGLSENGHHSHMKATINGLKSHLWTQGCPGPQHFSSQLFMDIVQDAPQKLLPAVDQNCEHFEDLHHLHPILVLLSIDLYLFLTKILGISEESISQVVWRPSPVNPAAHNLERLDLASAAGRDHLHHLKALSMGSNQNSEWHAPKKMA